MSYETVMTAAKIIATAHPIARGVCKCDALDEFYRIQQTGEYWQPDGNKTLDDAIHECRWAILKDALMQRGHDAVADFIGTDVSSDSYERLLDETEAQMPSEEFEKFWERYI